MESSSKESDFPELFLTVVGGIIVVVGTLWARSTYGISMEAMVVIGTVAAVALGFLGLGVFLVYRLVTGG